ncbi:MAG: TlpA family protein disulfide reductase [Bacteroidetes bacterium]|nr:TlpA family protein disulfide reductase [Bacteroidota bacterium]
MFKIMLAAALLFYHPFLSSAQPKHTIQDGIWRALLQRKDGKEIVFNFEAKDSAGKKILYIRNASERLLVDSILTNGDSIIITLPFFESQLRAKMNGKNEIRGLWLKRLVVGYQSMSFVAFRNQSFRFKKELHPPTANASGRWAVSFINPTNFKEEPAIGEFVQLENYVSGTFLTPTGDYRFLQGEMEGDSLRLSCFDGGHAYLFTAKVNEDSITGGQLFSGPTFSQAWYAKKNPNAALTDEFSLTKMKLGQSRFDFSFKDIDGKKVSILDPRFKNKVVLIQIMGSWCPNCMDETQFLSKLYDNYKKRGLEIIALAYERSTDFTRSQNSLRSFQKRFHVKYPILITGVSTSDSLRTQKTLPQMQDIVGFPTTIFINKKGEVGKIHTGFNGPGTGEHYLEQKKEIYDIIDGMLKE